MIEILEPFGPVYKLEGATLTKFRRSARKGLDALSKAERQEYGAAVERAVLASQRSALMRVAPSHDVHCASGTNHNTGAKIHEAVKAQQAAELRNCPGQIRRAREAHVWASMYAEAMAEKRARLAAPPSVLSVKPKAKAGAKTGKIAACVALLESGWVPADQILRQFGWVSNTFRGILGAQKRDHGFQWERKREGGKTFYKAA